MTVARNLLGTGLSGLAAQAIVGVTSGALTATGTVQGDAYVMSSDMNVFTTVASGTGAILPTGANCDRYTVVNSGANALLVYPPVGGTVGGLSANTGYSVGATGSATFTSQDGTNYASVGGNTTLAVAATTLSASGAVALSPANANVVISPTGTGVVTMAPATAGTLNNVSLGVTTPLAVKATTLTATTLFNLTGIEDSLTAAVGGTQAGALALSATKSVHRVTTVASAADSVSLPAAVAGAVQFVMNSAAANSMQIFGAATETINDVASATGVAIPAGKSAWFVCVSTGKWYMTLSA